ncbi:MAG: radical SAM protein [Candidatus Omnitrophota bacterium]
MLHKILYYLNWFWQCKVRGRKIPLTSSIILTDKCNLQCQHCTVSNLGYPDLSYETVKSDLKKLYDSGSRMLVVTGGEPFLWKNNGYHLEDVLQYAKDLGFFRIVVCTNGTFELKSNTDFLWVSLDGFPKEHNEIRGRIYDDVLKNIEQSNHRSIYINFTISKINLTVLERSAEAMFKFKNIKGILFHLVTPYIGSDKSIMLSQEERQEAIQTIYRIKKRHPLKVSNTFDGIKLLKTNSWKRPVWSSIVINQGEIGSCCCRKGIYDSDVCSQCGCSPATETSALQQLKPLAIIENLRFL